MAGTQSQMGFGAGAIPRKVTSLTSGTGTFTEQAGTSWLRVRMVSGGGGGGGGVGGSGFGPPGQAGSYFEFWLPATGVAKSYAVGAPGTVGVSSSSSAPGTDGGATTFGGVSVPGGVAGRSVASPNFDATGQPSPFGGYGRGGDGGQSSGTINPPTGGLIVVEEY